MIPKPSVWSSFCPVKCSLKDIPSPLKILF
nr:MAG TPA: Protein of unknown function (DUF2509) [Caudoviricetes sp.]